jgi:hypothetical protein
MRLNLVIRLMMRWSMSVLSSLGMVGYANWSGVMRRAVVGRLVI